MNLPLRIRTIVLTGSIFLCSVRLHAQSIRVDSCGINDSCEKIILIPNVTSDQPFVCIEGCNLNAAPAEFNNICGIGDFPTVWFEVRPDGNATLMNINVKSDEFDAPTFTLFQLISDCSHLQQVGMTQSNLSCIIGSNGEAEAIGSNIGSNEIYYIAVSSYNSVGGHFDICVNTIGQGSACVTYSQIQITARSEGGSLDGPFLPGETVSVCMNVNSYSAAGNGCQWFQGLIPFFGNGWDPSTFDSDGQPINGTINGEPFGVAGNGLYSVSTWDWFLEIGYHFDNPFFQIGDFDGNGTVEMCNVLYDVDCPNFGGTIGGCCGPCWANAGDPLPPGWFSYGINGTCPTLGPPPTVDWGDGNTCGGGMGPWHFCFDLLVRDFPDCLTDPTTRDLTLGFFTTADGETGSWTGGPSICSMDQPIKRTFELQCPTQIDLGFEELTDVCDNTQFVYEISEPGISHWTWDITPSWAVSDSIHEGDNGYVINSLLHNQLHAPVTVTYIFTGLEASTQNTLIKKVRFRILAPIVISFVEFPNVIDLIIVCSNDTNSIFISSEVQDGTGNYSYSWWPFGTTTPSLLILAPFYSTVHTLEVSDELGCTATKNFKVIVDQNCVVNHVVIHNDESNDDPKKEDPPPGGNIMNNHIDTRSVFAIDEESIKIYPIPSKDRVIVEWPQSLHNATLLSIYDTKEIELKALSIDQQAINQMEIDIRDLSSGVYILTLQAAQKVKSARFIKM